MLQNTQQQTSEKNELTPAAKNNGAPSATKTADSNAAIAAAQEPKPVYQTYIYRSYGGGYQGL